MSAARLVREGGPKVSNCDVAAAVQPHARVCICVPTYNAAATLVETIDSILAQSHRNLVVKISENASTDGTLQTLAAMRDPRLEVHAHDVNVGGEGNFTRCLRLADGEYTAIFHADDVYEPDIVATQVAYLDANPDVGAVFTRATTIDENGAPLGVIGGVPGRPGAVVRLGFRELLQIMLLHHNFLVCPSVMVRTRIYRDQIREWGDSRFRSAGDVDTWLRLALHAPIAVLEQPLMRYRISSTQFSHLNRNRTERADFFRVMDHYLALPEARAFLTDADRQHYGWLERHDRVARAMNLFGNGHVTEARPLVQGVVCRDAWVAASKTRRGLVTLAGGLLLQASRRFGLNRSGRSLIRLIKRISWR